MLKPDLVVDIRLDRDLNLSFGEEIDNFVTDIRRIGEALIEAKEPLVHIAYESAIVQMTQATTIKLRYAKTDVVPDGDIDFLPVCVVFTKSGVTVETETYLRHAVQIVSDYALSFLGFELDFRFIGGKMIGILDAVNQHFTFRFTRIGKPDVFKTIRLNYK